MELLIPGLILVALMIYASTRIKRTATEAFEAETIETDEFTVNKPDGFLNVLGGDRRFLLEAYTRDYGREEASKFRAATATLEKLNATSVESVASEMLAAGNGPVSDIAEVVGDHHYRVIEQQRVENGIELTVKSKLAKRGDDVYRFQMIIAPETSDDQKRNNEAMLNSFEIK